MDWKRVVEHVGEAIDVLGVLIMVVGIGVESVRAALRSLGRQTEADGDRRLRRDIGRAILLGLEYLVAGDIIRTVATNPTFAEVGVLAIIVLIRTFLSFTMELEVNGRWPWQGRSRTA